MGTKVTWDEWTDQVFPALGLGWPSQVVDAGTAVLWFDQLRGFEKAELDVAVGALLRTKRWMPSCAELREAADIARSDRLMRETWAVTALETPDPVGVPPPAEYYAWKERIGLMPKEEGSETEENTPAPANPGG